MNASTTQIRNNSASRNAAASTRANASALLRLAMIAGSYFGLATHAAPVQAGIFDAPTAQEIAAERDRCYRSKLCRALIDERPPAVMEAVNGEPQCAQNANIAAQSLLAKGHEVKIIEVRLPRARGNNDLHAFAATKIDGQWWAVDNGALPSCGRACRLTEALAGVEKLDESEPVAALAALERTMAVSQNRP